MADAKVVIRGDSSGAVKATDDVKKGFNDIPKSGSKATAALGRVAGALAVAAAGFTAFKKAMDLAAEFGEFERQTLRIGALLRATGAVSGQTRTELLKLASDVGRTTLLDERQVQDAIGVLLTFRSVQGETFERAIRLSADLSEVMGGDVRSATLQLAKALEQPTIGLTALRRSGIDFSEVQQEQIKLLVEQNRLFEAQTIILDQVAGQMDNVATRAAQGYAGALDGLGQSTREVTRVFGKHIAEALEPAIRKTDIYLRLLGMFADRSDRTREAIVAQAEAEARANRVEGLTLQQQVLQNINKQIQEHVALVNRYIAVTRDSNTSDAERRRIGRLLLELPERRKILQDALNIALQDETRFLEANTDATTASTTATTDNTEALKLEAAERHKHKEGLREQNAEMERGLALRRALYDEMSRPRPPADPIIPEGDPLDLSLLTTRMDTLQFAATQAQSIFSDLGLVMQGSFKKGDDAARRSFKTFKAFAIASTLISTYFSAQKAFESQIKVADPTAPIRAGIAAAAAVAAGLAKVAAIRSQNFSSSGGGGISSAGAGAGIGAGAGATRPSDTFVGPEGALFTAPPSDTPELVAQIDGRDLVFFLTNTQTDLEKVAIG